MTAEVKRNPDYTTESIKLPMQDLTFQHVDESDSDKKKYFSRKFTCHFLASALLRRSKERPVLLTLLIPL